MFQGCSPPVERQPHAGVMTLEVIALVILVVSSWIAGQMAYAHRVGVIEDASGSGINCLAQHRPKGVMAQEL